MVKSKPELKDALKRAFKDVSHPGRKIGDLEVRREWTKKQRDEVTIRDVNTGLSFFSDEALKYFLPPFLTIILDYPDEVDHWRIIGDLHQYDHIRLRHNKLCENFSEEQRQVLVDFFDNYIEIAIPSEEEIADLTTSLQKMARENSAKRIQVLWELRQYWEKCG